MWQLKYVFTRATPSIPWYYESSAEAAAATVVMDTILDSLISPELGDSIERTYSEFEARFTMTVSDPERATGIKTAMATNEQLINLSTVMLQYGVSMGNTAHSNDPEFPEDGEYLDLNQSISEL